MRQRIEVGGLDSEERIEEIGERDAFRLRGQPEQPPVAVQRPRPPGLLNNQARLVIAVQKLLVGPASEFVGVRQRHRAGTVPTDVHDADLPLAEDAEDDRPLGQFL